MICARSEISRQASCEVVYGFTLAGRHHSLYGPSVERCLLKNTFPPVCLGVPRDCWKPELGRRGGCTPELLVVMCGTPVITVGFFFFSHIYSVPWRCRRPLKTGGRRGGCKPELLVVMCGTPVITEGFFGHIDSVLWRCRRPLETEGRRCGCTPKLLMMMCGTPVITVGFFGHIDSVPWRCRRPLETRRRCDGCTPELLMC